MRIASHRDHRHEEASVLLWGTARPPSARGEGEEFEEWKSKGLFIFPAGDVRDKNRLRIGGGRERKKRARKGRVGCVREGLKCVDSSEGLRRP